MLSRSLTCSALRAAVASIVPTVVCILRMPRELKGRFGHGQRLARSSSWWCLGGGCGGDRST